MSLIRWQPWRELDTLRQQIDHLFDELVHTEAHPLLPKQENVTWAPAIELQETDDSIIVKAQIPGVDAKNLDVQVSQDAVSIAGEHREEKKTEEKGIIRSEFRYGSFQRIVPLPAQIENERVKSEFKDGVLVLTLPKVAGASRKVVKVDLGVQEKAREGMTQQRQHEEHVQATMQSRAAAEVKGATS